MAAVASAVVALALTQAASAHSAYRPPNLHLVRADTLRVEATPPTRRGRHRVAEVLAGDPRLVGREFASATFNGPYMGSGPPIEQRPVTGDVGDLQVGCEGLWWVSDSPGGLKPADRRVLEAYGLLRFPCQKLTTATLSTLEPARQYKEGSAAAEGVASVYRARTPAARAELLRRLAADPTSPVDEWAVCVLARGDWPAHAAFLAGLAADNKLSERSRSRLRQLAREHAAPASPAEPKKP